MSDLTEYKCPSCGAPMHFDINKQRVVCSFCASSYDLEYIRSHFNEVTDEKLSDFNWVERTKYVWEPDMLEELTEYTCSSCGGNIITKNITASTKCPFCDHNVVISSNFAGDLRPDKVIPFKVKAEEFAEKYRENIANAGYAPKEFADLSVTDNIFGCYIPIWVYSCTCNSQLNNSDGVIYKIKDYPIPATDFKKDILHSVEPFVYDEAVDFTESCLTGFYASRYSIGAENAMNSADKAVKSACIIRASDNTGKDFNPQFALNNSVIEDKQLTYYLVPIWFLNVPYKNKNYTFAMNGQTGEFVSSNVPLSKRSSKHFWTIFMILEILTFLFLFVTSSFETSKTEAIINTVFTLPELSVVILIIAYVIYSHISKKYIGGLRSAQRYSIMDITDYFCVEKTIK